MTTELRCYLECGHEIVWGESPGVSASLPYVGFIAWCPECEESQAIERIELDGKPWNATSTRPIPVEYNGGESRQHPGEGIDYMLATVPSDTEPQDIELYAEAEPVEGDETATYEGLAAEILCQAVAAGVDVTRLEWHMDPPMLTTAQAADILGLTGIRVRQLCAQGRMGRKVGRDYVISVEDIERNRERAVAGRPIYLGSIRHSMGTGRVRLYWRTDGYIYTGDGEQAEACPRHETWEDAADAALTIWSGPTWDMRASARVSRLYGGIIRR